MNLSGVRELALRLIDGKAERGKVDFKRDLSIDTSAQKAEFCKDLSAIANTDDDRLEGYGFIILGAEAGTLRGAVTAWATVKFDNFSAALTDIAKTYLAPVPAFTLLPFEDANVGAWGVVVIPPSLSQPHIFIKELSGNPGKHEWFVRINDTTERAGALDYARILHKAAYRATRPLETAVQRLSLRLEALEDTRNNTADLIKVIAANRTPEDKSSPTTDEDAVQDSGNVAAVLRRELSTRESRIADQLAREALGVRALMWEDRPENPTRFSTNDAAELVRPIEYMEAQTRPFADAVATVARYDTALKHANEVADAFEVFAEEPQLVSPHWDHADDLRLYPLAIALYALALVSAARNDGRLLRKVLDRDLRRRQPEDEVPMIRALQAVRGANGLFNGAMQQRYFEPVAQRLLVTVPTWCAPLIPGKDAEAAFYQAEFAFALEYIRVETAFHGSGWPMAGAYLYATKGEASVLTMVKRHSAFLQHLFPKDLEQRLETFDANIGEVVNRESYRRSFARNKTKAAWSSTDSSAKGAG